MFPSMFPSHVPHVPVTARLVTPLSRDAFGLASVADDSCDLGGVSFAAQHASPPSGVDLTSASVAKAWSPCARCAARAPAGRRGGTAVELDDPDYICSTS